ncbi:hypothetical protein QTH77_13345 [Clostridium perfringens]|uniref:hypothetical protein n=1 Tax=Clostridium perfringens TaxID=1502 RepID=UPI002940599E|nr:hypothetical protein [Clostridium perfringens]MDM0713231.1 hypothetical protein [Clostridium perfringens]MDV5089310.1 hypothetical protein [Clostridium perfringens]MDV5107359.1 hypothetical protein [Clostridium perfringens]
MEKSFLMNKVKEIQNEYLNMLINIKDKIDTVDYMFIIDEINIFWYSKREIVKLYLSNITLKDNIYIFTGATYLDVDDFEHYPFIMMGNSHIVDDPLCKYSKIVPSCKSAGFLDTLRNQIICSVEDNIKIISQYSSSILILPLHLLYDNDMKIISEAANDIFLSLFSIEGINMNTYFKDFKSIHDVVKALKPGIEKYIVFDEGENLEKGIEERFRNYMTKINIPIPEEKNDAFKFWFTLYGFLLQALDIILCCTQFKLIPYLRCRVTFQYVILLGENFCNVSEVKEMLFRCKVAHIVYMIFNKEKFKEISFENFHNKLEEYKFNDNVYEDIRADTHGIDNINVNQIVEILDKNIKKCFDDI